MRWIAFCFVVVAGAGCVTTSQHAQDLALAPDALGETTTLADRNRVRIVILNGSDPFVSLASLREALNKGGFAKVSVGGLMYAPFFESAIRREHQDDPEARFILIGYGLGAGLADRVAARLSGEGVPVDTVVAMSPRAWPFEPATPESGVRRVVIRGRSGASPLELTENVAFTLDDVDAVAGDAAAAELVLNVAGECCRGLSPAAAPPVSVLAMIDHPAPLPNARPMVVNAPVPAKKPVTGVLTGSQLNK